MAPDDAMTKPGSTSATSSPPDATADDQPSQVRHIEATLRSDRQFPVPSSDGYTVYSALLSVLRDADAGVSDRVHDSELGSLRVSGLLGTFGGSDRDKHKTVRTGEAYRLDLGVVDPADDEIFQALVKAFVINGVNVDLTEGSLRVESVGTEQTTHAALLQRAGELADPTLELHFQTPTCIFAVDDDGDDQDASDDDRGHGGVTTMFPHRGAVFTSLRDKWNRTAPDELALDLIRADIERSVIEKPDPRSYGTDSVVVSRGEDGRPIHRQGFHGTCSYAFKGASESVQNAITALALFSEYSGVGSAVSQGCGTTGVQIHE